ncbi:MAG: hypothetical protein ACR2PZ_19585 [Pseudomonadales bacterium]
MQSQILVKRISGGTTFKLIFIGFLVFHVSSTLLVAALVLLGILPLEATDSAETVSPLLAVIAYLLIGMIFSPIWVGALWLSIWPGVWLYSLIRPVNLGYIPAVEKSNS